MSYDLKPYQKTLKQDEHTCYNTISRHEVLNWHRFDNQASGHPFKWLVRNVAVVNMPDDLSQSIKSNVENQLSKNR